jgi:hypothetical protein
MREFLFGIIALLFLVSTTVAILESYNLPTRLPKYIVTFDVNSATDGLNVAVIPDEIGGYDVDALDLKGKSGNARIQIIFSSERWDTTQGGLEAAIRKEPGAAN